MATGFLCVSDVPSIHIHLCRTVAGLDFLHVLQVDLSRGPRSSGVRVSRISRSCPLPHDAHAVGDGLGPEDVVAGHEDGLASPRRLLDDLQELEPALGVQPAGGLVEDDQPGVLQDRDGDAQSLAHALGEAATRRW